MNLLSSKFIEKKILDNYVEFQYLFLEFQSKFLSGLHTRYQSVENGNLVLYFAKQTHQEILRLRDYDLNFNISYEKFWENHSQIKTKRLVITRIAEDTLLPKETARRKILQLIKQKVLDKKNKSIGWLPNDQYKQSYNLAIKNEIDDVCKLISFIYRKANLSISNEEVAKEIKEKFSFCWFHYLGAQLEYLRLWSKHFNDLELILIMLQILYLYAAKTKEKNLSHKNIYDNPNLLQESISASISATSIADVTGIPRATCVRKLDILVKMKMIERDKISKRYYVIPRAISEDLIPQKITEKVIKIFSNFFFICTKVINIKT
jgi:DNA-binding MarR family transcriptional regulator